ncbi:protein of unknown function (plasmid) [Thermococcus nautili]|uniref:hypothetical protein n=1 Tax=Thermococcus nautili TaxID=195522 RepID=UPI0025534D54|nr:hypothetical protein [Thermococcus nautili]CAI1494202.1 protein of unknown function [Thermococcus nautili]
MNLSDVEKKVVEAIRELGGETNGCELIDKLGLSASEILSILNDLQDKGVVELTPICTKDKIILHWRLKEVGA